MSSLTAFTQRLVQSPKLSLYTCLNMIEWGNWATCITLMIFGGATLHFITINIVYNVYMHPLASYPGPKLWRISKLPFDWHTIRGTSAHKLIELHNKYGPVVRYSPNCLTYIAPESWAEIYGPYNGKKHMEMDPTLFGGNVTVTGALQITNAVGEDHRRLRNRFMQGLNSKAIAEQEPVLIRLTSLFIDGIRTELSGSVSETVDIAKWFSLATFDMIGELSFGKSFGNLETGEYHPWVLVVFGAFKALPFLRILREIPGMMWLGNYAVSFLPMKLKQMWYDHFNYAFGLIEQRFQNPKEKKDVIYYIFEDGGNDLTRDEIRESAAQLVMAGSEPTATFLTGLVYYLDLHPKVLAKLTDEIDSSFATSGAMTISALMKLPYLSAVISEGLRLFPPAPDLFPRIIPEGGETIMGKYLPAGVRVSISALAASQSASNFDNPQQFIPERWEKAGSDSRMKASCPFGQGHRSCLGKTLALAEIRLLVANFLWNFDFEVSPEDRDWLGRCRVFLGWEKPALRMRLSVRE